MGAAASFLLWNCSLIDLPEENSVFSSVGIQACQIELSRAFRINDGTIDTAGNRFPPPDVADGGEHGMGEFGGEGIYILPFA